MGTKEILKIRTMTSLTLLFLERQRGVAAYVAVVVCGSGGREENKTLMHKCEQRV